MGRDLCIIIRLKFGAIYLISKLGLSLDLSISRSLDLSISLSLMFMKHSIKTHIYQNKSIFQNQCFVLLQLVYISLALCTC